MKRFLYSLTLFTLFLSACDFSPFSGNEQQADNLEESTEPGAVFLNVDITGGFAGVQQNLQLDDSGNALFKDSLRPGANWKIQLTTEQLEDIKELMVDIVFFY